MRHSLYLLAGVALIAFAIVGVVAGGVRLAAPPSMATKKETPHGPGKCTCEKGKCECCPGCVGHKRSN